MSIRRDAVFSALRSSWLGSTVRRITTLSILPGRNGRRASGLAYAEEESVRLRHTA
jgi:hypothetical protein